MKAYAAAAFSLKCVQVVLVLCLLVTADQSDALDVSETPIFAVSSSNLSAFATPVAYFQKNIYVVSVEPSLGISNGVNLRTVVRKGYQSKEEWIWETAVIDDATLDDPYHTQASIAVDKDGFIHVAYNMHHMPWQYAVSRRPEDVTSFDFRGDVVSLAEKAIVKHLNKTSFPSLGKAAIPGNQITYPAFFYDRQGELYVTYRFATRPKKSFNSRGFALALARYDAQGKRWLSLGGQINVTSADADLPEGVSKSEVKAFLFSEGWMPMLLRLFFDKENHLHLSWTWREFYSDSPFVRPSYAYGGGLDRSFARADGRTYVLPINMQDSGLLYFNHPDIQLTSPLAHLTADPNGVPYVVTLQKGKSSTVSYFDDHAKQWSDPEPMPEGAQRMEIDDTGKQWAFATGLKIFSRLGAAHAWQKVYEDRGLSRFGHLKVLNIHEQNQFLIYAQSVDEQNSKVYIVRR
jgi:hypothetical protein